MFILLWTNGRLVDIFAERLKDLCRIAIRRGIIGLNSSRCHILAPVSAADRSAFHLRNRSFSLSIDESVTAQLSILCNAKYSLLICCRIYFGLWQMINYVGQMHFYDIIHHCGAIAGCLLLMPKFGDCLMSLCFSRQTRMADVCYYSLSLYIHVYYCIWSFVCIVIHQLIYDCWKFMQ